MFQDLYRKVLSPPEKHGLLFRPRLEDLLSKVIEQNLVKITAGAGYGKTQTVSMFLHRHNYRTLWMQFSKLDNLPTMFWEKFISALALQENDLALFLKQLDFPESLEDFIRCLHVFTDNVQKGERFIFVFDDFHIIHEELIINFIENLIALNTERFGVIIMSRSAIDLGNIRNIYFSEEDLRFTLSETEEYLKMSEMELPALEIEEIQEYTEGWPLAIHLISLYLKKNDIVFKDSLTKIGPIIFEIIENEIFSLYTAEWQEFLIKLSLLESFPVKLLNELTDENIVDVMNTLNSNMFIYYNTYTDEYYFHHLFLDFLYKKQICLNSKSLNDIYWTAAEWYAKNNIIMKAMSYYEECGRHDKSWDIILHRDPDRHPKEKASLFIRCLNGFPDEFIRQNPMVRVIRASLMLNNMELEPAANDLLDLIKELKHLPPTTENKAMTGEAYIVMALIRHTQKDCSYVNYLKMAAENLPHGSIRNYRNIKMVDSNNALTPRSLEPKELERYQKDLFEAIPYASKAMNGLGYGVEYLSAAILEYYKYNLTKSQEYTFEAIYMARQKEQHDIICNAYFLLMQINTTKGNYNTLVNYMKQLREYVQDFNIHLSILDIAESWFFIKVGKRENVARWLLNDSLNSRIYPPISIGRDRLIRANYFLEERRYNELINFSKELDKLYLEKGLWLELIFTRIFKALALYYVGNIAECVVLFRSIYRIVNKVDFIMQLVEMGKHTCNMIEGIRKINDYGIPDVWLDNIYTKASTYTKRQAFIKSKYNSGINREVNILLTNREKEILNDLCQGLTRKEISVSLDISINTVKSMLQNIYSKLGAANSADAVRIAIQMKFI